MTADYGTPLSPVTLRSVEREDVEKILGALTAPAPAVQPPPVPPSMAVGSVVALLWFSTGLFGLGGLATLAAYLHLTGETSTTSLVTIALGLALVLAGLTPLIRGYKVVPR